MVDFNVLSTGHGQPTTKRERDRQTDSQGQRGRETHTENSELRTLLHKDYDFRQFWKETDRQTERQTDKDRDRQTDRQRQTQRQRYTERMDFNVLSTEQSRPQDEERERGR